MAAFRALLWFLRQDGSLVATMTKFVGLLAVVGILFWVVFVLYIYVPLTFSQGSWVDSLPSESWAQTWWNTAGFTSGWLSRVFFGKSTEHVWQLEFQSSTAESCDLALQSPNQSLAGGSFVFVFKSPMVKVFRMDWNQSDRYDRKHNCFFNVTGAETKRWRAGSCGALHTDEHLGRGENGSMVKKISKHLSVLVSVLLILFGA